MAFFFSGGLGRCNKMAVKLELKNDSQPVFKKNRNAPFTSLTHIHKELQRLEQIGVISKIQYKWATPAVYIKKKIKRNSGLRRFLYGPKCGSKRISRPTFQYR